MGLKLIKGIGGEKYGMVSEKQEMRGGIILLKSLLSFSTN